MLEKLLTGGGLTAALGASTCCVLPVSLAALGLGGAWISTLAILAQYRTAFSIAAILLLGFGFWLVYARRTAAHDDAACPTGSSRRATKAFLWVGAVVMTLVLSSGWWQQLIA